MKQKTLTVIALLAALLPASMCQAKRCVACNEILPDSAAICTSCLTPQPKIVKLEPEAPLTAQQRLVELFSFLDDFEKYFHENQYLNMLGLMPEVKIKFQNAVSVYQTMAPNLPEELKILAKLYAAKYQVFEGITAMQKNLRLESSFREALIRANMYKMALCNSIIAPFKASSRLDENSAINLKRRVASIEKRMYKYTVTAKYLKVGDTKIARGSKILITSISGKNARVLVIASTGKFEPVEAFVSLKGLAKRTDWVKENAKYYAD